MIGALLLVMGLLSAIAGIALWKGSVVLAGLVLMGFVLFIELSDQK